jgi:hypothetical protein
MQELKSKGLYGIFMRRLNEIGAQTKREIIPFPAIFEKLCRNFSLKKQECWEILFILRDTGFIKIVPYHGVKIC